MTLAACSSRRRWSRRRRPSPRRRAAPARRAAAGGRRRRGGRRAAAQEDEIQPGVEVSGAGRRHRRHRHARPNIVRQTPQVVSVLSGADIARTGEGDIAGALQRVTGLSVVGNGFVFVRGLGDRYSLALLNGSPLPSPEPLRRVVPLDIFPTGVIASSLVQKSYSVNYPGEFGGGVINLTTPAVPRETFLDVGVSASGDVETTFKLGYSYYGSDTDWTGFDDGTRDFPAALRDAVAGGTFNATTDAERRDFAASLINAPTTVLQRMSDTPGQLLGRDQRRHLDRDRRRPHRLHRRGRLQQQLAHARRAPADLDRPRPRRHAADPASGRVTTDNRIIVNGLLGLGAEFGEHQIRWTNLYIRDTLKQGRLAAGFNRIGPGPGSGAAALGDGAEHLLVRAPADRHPAGRRVPLRRFQRRSARRLCQFAARIAL